MNYARCVIITSYIDAAVRDLISITEEDFVICADGGYAHALRESITPNLLIGDFDSYNGPLPVDIKVMQVPAEKDYTDTGLCLQYALDRGFETIAVAGGLGGRFDHALSNLQSMADALAQNPRVRITIYSLQNTVTMLTGGALTVPSRPDCKLSLLAYSDVCTGVSVSGVHYPLSDVVLTNRFPLGVSNEFEAETAEVRVRDGNLLVIVSRD